MNDLGDLRYSDEANITRFLYYKDLNEINIFFEDKGKEYLYETILKRLLGDRYKIESFFGLGGKDNVKKAFLEYGIEDKENPSKKNIYIVDGDFDRYIFYDDMINSPNFIYLKTYNIENYFIDENACLSFVKGQLKLCDCEVKEKLKFSYWQKRIVEESSKLFLVYCFVMKFHSKIPSVSRKAGEFLDQNTGFERTDKSYENYWTEIQSIDTEAEKRILDIKNKYIEINGEDFFNLICGKFLFKSLCWYIKKIIESSFNQDDFEWHLINNFDITKLNYVKEYIIEIMSEQC